MRILLTTLIVLGLSVCLAAQEPPFCGDGNVDFGEVCDDGNNIDWDGCKGDCSLIESSEDIQLYRELVAAETEKANLLHTQQEFNQSNKNQRKSNYDATILKWEEQKTEALDNGSLALIESIQKRIDRLEADRDWYDSNVEGSPSDKASKLGPQINELSELIEQLKEQLGIQ